MGLLDEKLNTGSKNKMVDLGEMPHKYLDSSYTSTYLECEVNNAGSS